MIVVDKKSYKMAIDETKRLLSVQILGTIERSRYRGIFARFTGNDSESEPLELYVYGGCYVPNAITIKSCSRTG